jgi:hypothetical protein
LIRGQYSLRLRSATDAPRRHVESHKYRRWSMLLSVKCSCCERIAELTAGAVEAKRRQRLEDLDGGATMEEAIGARSPCTDLEWARHQGMISREHQGATLPTNLSSKPRDIYNPIRYKYTYNDALIIDQDSASTESTEKWHRPTDDTSSPCPTAAHKADTLARGHDAHLAPRKPWLKSTTPRAHPIPCPACTS